jgi:hypothetical protein
MKSGEYFILSSHFLKIINFITVKIYKISSENPIRECDIGRFDYFYKKI